MLNDQLMNRKFILVFALLVLGILAGNWIYGSILAKKIEERLETRVKALKKDIVLEIEKVHVNPLLSKLQLKGLQVSTVEGHQLAAGQSVVLDMPYKEAIRLLNSKEIDELKSLKLKVEELQLYIAEADGELLIDNLLIDFDGDLNRADIEAIQTIFPTEKQRLRIQAKGVKLAQTPWMDALGFSKEQSANINQFEQLIIDCQLHPQKSHVELIKFQLNSDVLDCQSSGLITYTGEGLSGAKAEKAETSFKLSLNEKGLTWGNAETTGKFTLDKLTVETNALVLYKDNVPSVESQKSNILLENLTLEYAGEKRAQLEAQTALLGLKMDKIIVSKLAFSSELAEDWLTITDSELQSTFMDIDLNAKVHISSQAPGASQIESATLVVSNLAPGIQNGIATFELMTMQSLPRNGDAIVLEMTGPISRPVIKGLRY
ncbi:hypothetical protein KDU71_07330 [Carboxylicivirga sediminis]|uniref:Uncharacterized protein n=1 Tax=Carboxylicivirga sediminis TaxID=2006564 RepID=A0A941F2X6_9BACT|nr:hypothetical protein [Carboxylicivirga sediminis]MBR8535367.1 hypothetical protein [Carboxylicivirga sediminis]